MSKEDDNCVLKLYSTGRSDVVAWYQIWQAVEATFGTYKSEVILLFCYTYLGHKASLGGKRTFLLPALVLQPLFLSRIRDADSENCEAICGRSRRGGSYSGLGPFSQITPRIG